MKYCFFSRLAEIRDANYYSFLNLISVKHFQNDFFKKSNVPSHFICAVYFSENRNFCLLDDGFFNFYFFSSKKIIKSIKIKILKVVFLNF